MVPIPSIVVLKYFTIYRNSSGLIFLNVGTFSSYVLDVADAGSQCVLILMMLYYLNLSVAAMIRGINGGSIRYWKSALIQLGFPSFMVRYPGILRNGSVCHT